MKCEHKTNRLKTFIKILMSFELCKEEFYLPSLMYVISPMMKSLES